VVRTLAKARWNILHGLTPDHALSKLERQAFFGWRALHAEGVAPSQRLEALASYAAAGGAHAELARAILLYRSGDARGASELLAKLEAKGGSARTHNYLVAARIVAGHPR